MREMRGEVEKKTPKNEMDNSSFFMTSRGRFLSDILPLSYFPLILKFGRLHYPFSPLGKTQCTPLLTIHFNRFFVPLKL